MISVVVFRDAINPVTGGEYIGVRSQPQWEMKEDDVYDGGLWVRWKFVVEVEMTMAVDCGLSVDSA